MRKAPTGHRGQPHTDICAWPPPYKVRSAHRRHWTRTPDTETGDSLGWRGNAGIVFYCFSECFCIIPPRVEDGYINRPFQLCVMSAVTLAAPSAGWEPVVLLRGQGRDAEGQTGALGTDSPPGRGSAQDMQGRASWPVGSSPTIKVAPRRLLKTQTKQLGICHGYPFPQKGTPTGHRHLCLPVYFQLHAVGRGG